MSEVLRVRQLLGGGSVPAWCGRVVVITALAITVAQFEAAQVASAVGIALLGVALVRTDGTTAPPRSAVVAAALAAALGLLIVAGKVAACMQVTDGPDGSAGTATIVGGIGILIGAAGVLLLRLGRSGLAHLCGVVISLGAWVVLSAYIYRIAPMAESPPTGSGPLLTAIGLDVVGLGLIWLTPSYGLVGLAQRGPAASLLVRVGVPVLVLFPMAIGGLNLTAVRYEWYSPQFSVAVMAMAAGTVGGVVLWYTARAIVALDQARVAAMDELATSNARLEEQVAERTASLESQSAIQMASLEALEQGVAICSIEGEVLLLNRAGRSILGFEPDELTELYRSGKWMVRREDGSIIPEEERAVGRTLRNHEVVSGFVVRARRKDGREVTLRVNTKPIFDEAGKRVGAVVALVDITAEREAQRMGEEHVVAVTELNARLERAVRMKNRLLSTATHDMRSPIATVIGFSELLSRDDLPVADEQRSAYLNAIHRQGRRLEALVQDLMAVSVIDGGTISFDPRPMHLEDTIRQVAMDSGLEGQVEIRDPDGAIVFADPMRLAQILTNLFQNAARYGRPPFVVSAVPEGSEVVVRVCDHGDGVDANFVPRLFDAYSMGPPRPGVESTGTGLGLAIVRGLTRLHGGEAWYEPNEPAGSCFAIRLPAGTSIPTAAGSPLDGSLAEAGRR